MNRYILDTHIFIWNIYNRKMLSRQLIDELDDYNNSLYISRLSLLEIAIKNRDGNLELGEDYGIFIRNIERRMGVRVLDLDNRHLVTLNMLFFPKTHKDPFDHVIVSQAISERMCLISADPKMSYYKKQGLELLEN